MKKILNKTFIAIFVFIIVIFIRNISKATELTSDYYKIDNEKNIISIIEPETSIEEFKSKLKYLNNEIHVYKNLELTEEVTTGLVGTGMYLKDDNKVYELSVVGDFDGDGKANQVELTNIIRYIVGLKGATLEGVRYISADLTLDGQVDQRDITKFIKYIVYGELDLGKEDNISIPDGEEQGAIIFGQITWENGKAKVEISTNTNYYIEYQINSTSGAWTKGATAGANTTATELNHNDVIYARLTNGTNAGQYTSLTIKDTTPPQVDIATTAGATEITATVTAQDHESGIDEAVKYTYYIKEAQEPESSYVQKENIANSIYTFTGLEQNTDYTIKVEIEDRAGNKGIKEISETTQKIPDGEEAGSIIFSNIRWTNGQAEVEISTNTNYIIEYQVNSTSGAWTKGTTAGAKITATELNHNDTIYARLTNGTNAGQYTTLTIKDTTPPQVNITTTPGTSEITATVIAQDYESGIDEAVKYTYYIKEAGESESSYIQKESIANSTYTFTGLEQDTSYTIKVEIEDKAGNKGTKELSETTQKIPDGEDAGSLLFSNVTWTSGQAEVEISTNTNYYIEYQVNSTSGAWTKGTAGGQSVKVTGLNHNDVIYARLTDGTAPGNYCSITIVDTISPNVNLQLQAQNQTIDATAIGTDNESGIDTNATYKFYMKETGANDSTYVEKQNTTQKTLSIQNLTVGKNYTIKVEVTDKAGNKGIQEKSILIPDDIAPVVTLTKTSQTSSSATIEANATDVGGLPDPTIYIFYIKETGAADSTYIEKQNSTSKTYTFTGLEQDKDYTVKVEVSDEAGNKGIKEMSVLTDQIPDAETAGAINFENIVWSNGKAEVTISTNTTYKIEYQVNSTSGAWTKGTTAGQNVKVTGLNHNDTIYARLTDEVNSTNAATLTVIDGIKPTVTLSATSNSTSEIVATANATDNETGIDTNATYKFYIKELSGTYVEKQNTTSKTCTFTGLKQGTNYTIKVEIADKAGNKGTKETSITTKSIPDAETTAGAIAFSTITWNNGKAETTISTNTTYKIEYQVNSTSGTWTKGTTAGQSVKVTVLNHNDTIYARLTDGTNAGQYATLKVTDGIKPTVTLSATSNSTSEIVATANATDNETGIDTNATYKFYIKEPSGTYVEKQNTTSKTCTFTGLKQGTNYTIKVEIADKAGNKGTKETSITTKSIPDAVTTAGAITFSTITWSNGKAETTISTNSTYKIEYQVNSTSGTWTKGTTAGQSVKVTGLNHNDTIYARLTDGTNAGQYATLKVVDTIKPKDFKVSVTNITTTGFKVSGQTTDNETGIKNYTYVVEKKVTTSKTKENNEDVGGIISASSNTKTEGYNINRISNNSNSATNTSRSNNISIRRK